MARSIEDMLADAGPGVVSEADARVAKRFGVDPTKITPEMRATYNKEVEAQIAPRVAAAQAPDNSVMGQIFSGVDKVVTPVVDKVLSPIAKGVMSVGAAAADPLKAVRDLGGGLAKTVKDIVGASGVTSTAGSSRVNAVAPSASIPAVGAPSRITSEQISNISAPLSNFQAPTMSNIDSRYIYRQEDTVKTLQDLINQQQLPELQQSRFNDAQANALANLAQSASGAGPSPAQLMLAAQNDANTRQAMALAASQSGRALPAVQRQIMEQAALGGQQAAQQSAILRAQEMLAAQNQYASAVQGARGQDINMAGLAAQQAQFENAQQLQAAQAAAAAVAQGRAQDISTAQANQQAQLAASGQKLSALQSAAQTTAGLTSAERGAASQDFGTSTQGTTAMAKIAADTSVANMRDATERKIAEDQARAAIISGVIGGGAGIAASLIGKK